MNLFGERKKVKPVKPVVPDQGVHRVITAYIAAFRERYGEDPLIEPRDGAAVKRLLASATIQTVEQRVRAYLELADPYLEERGYPLSLLPGAWNRITVRLGRVGKRAHGVEETSAYLRRLRGGS